MNFEDIGGILSGMSDEELSALGSIAEQFLGKEESKDNAADTCDGIDPQLLTKLMQLLPVIQGGADNEKTRLIAALKPLLSPQRRKKADEAIQLMRITEIFSVFNSDSFPLF